MKRRACQTSQEGDSALADPTILTFQDLDVEVFLGGPASGLVLCAAHPADRFEAATVELLADTTHARTVCVNPWRLGSSEASGAPSLDEMVDRVEEVRRRLGIERWIFWGMSGGGWLAQIYARRHPGSLAGIVIESACLCFRERVNDPECVLSPRFPAWQGPLAAAGLLSEDPEDRSASGNDTEWFHVDGVGQVFRRRGGPALLVSPGPLAREMESIMPRLWEFDSRPWIRAIRTPALVLCGTADPVVPVRHARAVHEAIHGSSFQEIEGAGHVPTAGRHPEAAAAFRSFAMHAAALDRRRASVSVQGEAGTWEEGGRPPFPEGGER